MSKFCRFECISVEESTVSIIVCDLISNLGEYRDLISVVVL